ncbi:MAG TPA: FAD-dependent monooxygenase [Pusillimonas sp.]|uniref:FAD-dependent monooxygenase n=1 Tax=Pusillimonas sp. TaxID=3040095 RepID=UPI002CA35654|nr:FAD-dependent monooxygenase [Pusillimonas sp.]HUH88276.1 FAD-dependent monooxygenase [Pusillimonas sp.]
MLNSRSTVLIVGGGIGGLTAAIALAQKGRSVRVLEQAHEISAIGYGIQLGPNVFNVFSQLGIADSVRSIADFPDSVCMIDADDGRTLIDIPVTTQEYKQRFRNPYVVVHRADIHNVLLDTCLKTPSIEVTVNAAVVAHEDLGDHVRVTCSDGRTFEGAALIAADGLKSRARELLVKDELCPIGYVAHRTIVDMADIPSDFPYRTEVVLWSGPGYHVVHYPLRQGTLFNIVAVFKDPAPQHGDQYVTHEQEVRHVYANAHPALKKILSLMDLERRWIIADRNPIRRWNRGRIVLLGDAAHPVLQSYAQGAGMAIEDAGCIADLLDRHGFEDAFAEFSKQRALRTARIQLEGREVWKFYHEEGIGRDVRNAQLEGRTVEDSYKCLDWIWNGHPTLSPAEPSIEPLTSNH